MFYDKAGPANVCRRKAAPVVKRLGKCNLPVVGLPEDKTFEHPQLVLDGSGGCLDVHVTIKPPPSNASPQVSLVDAAEQPLMSYKSGPPAGFIHVRFQKHGLIPSRQQQTELAA